MTRKKQKKRKKRQKRMMKKRQKQQQQQKKKQKMMMKMKMKMKKGEVRTKPLEAVRYPRRICELDTSRRRTRSSSCSGGSFGIYMPPYRGGPLRGSLRGERG